MTRSPPIARSARPCRTSPLCAPPCCWSTARRLPRCKSASQPLAEPGRSFRASARELLALSAWHNHDAAAARKYIDMIAADAETPPGARARAEMLSALIAAGGKS